MNIIARVKAVVWLSLCFLLLAHSSFAADATSYPVNGVTINQHMNMHGYNVNNSASYGMNTGGYLSNNGSSNVSSSPTGYHYLLNPAWSSGVVSSGFYQDYDDGGYYVDPNGTSNVNRFLVNYYPTWATDAANKAYVDAQAGGTLSAGVNGFYRFPNGLIMQWMTVTVPNQNVTTGAWATPFPSVCLNVQVTNTLVGWGATNTHYGATGTASQWTIYKGADTQLTFRLFAIGY